MDRAEMYMVVYGDYSGAEKRAVEMICGCINGYIGEYSLTAVASDTVKADDLKGINLVLIGTTKSNRILADLAGKDCFKTAEGPEGYSIKVCDSAFDPQRQMFIISGYDAAGVLYGVVDFEAYYIPGAETADRNENYFHPLFRGEKMTEWEKVSSPSVKMRGLWTWGHVIYDYRGYIENMMRLKMNTLIVWNDYMPLNIRDIISFAHQRGIGIYLGFSWGWDEARPQNHTGLDISKDEDIGKIKDSIIRKYKEIYRDFDIDGIYFQSFTETNAESVNGTVIAERVVELVNSTAEEIFSMDPQIRLMFGLHATSVSNKLEYISRTDKRIRIVWEDCGAFPFSYFTGDVGNYRETRDFAEKTACLRGEYDSYGAVTKGMVCLDWDIFEHQTGPFVMGEYTRDFIKHRAEKKRNLWKFIDAAWMRNGSYAYDMIKHIHTKNPHALMTALVEDGLFEYSIPYSVALYAEMLWDCGSDFGKLTEKVMGRRDVVC